MNDNSKTIIVAKGTLLKRLDEPIKELFEYLNNTYHLSALPNIDIERDENEIRSVYAQEEIDNSIASKRPQLVDEWDYEKNYPLKPEQIPAFSNKKFAWICPNNHSYYASPNHRSNGRNCPLCYKIKRSNGKNNLR